MTHISCLIILDPQQQLHTHTHTHKNRQDININIIHIIRKKNQLQPINFDVSHEEFHSFFGSIRTHYITSYITSPVITITWVRYYNYNFSLHSCHFNLILILIYIKIKKKKSRSILVVNIT